jgi:hypothetical protein
MSQTKLSRKLKRHLKILVLKRRYHLTKSTSIFPWKKPLKNQFWKAALPYRMSGSFSALYPLLGECCNALFPIMRECCPFLSEFWTVEENQGRIPLISGVGWIWI